MKLIVGLGNPGAGYENTRHNAGFMVIDALAARHRIVVDTHERDALTGRGRIAGESVVLAKPTTFMNRSGSAVLKLVRKYLDGSTDLSDLLVIYDDVDLALGTLRIRERGSPGTHNGMRSLCASLESEDFPRLRFGVRGETLSQTRDLADYVLEDFTDAERRLVEETIQKTLDAIIMITRGEIRRAMTSFNRTVVRESEA